MASLEFKLGAVTLFLLLIELFSSLPSSLACPNCPHPTPRHPKVRAPFPYPKPKPKPQNPVVQPPLPPIIEHKPPPHVMPPRPPIVEPPPYVKPPPHIMPPWPPIFRPPPLVMSPMPPIFKPPPFVMPPMPPIFKHLPVDTPPMPPIFKPPPFAMPPMSPIFKPPPFVDPPMPSVVGPKPWSPNGRLPCRSPPAPPSAKTCPVDALKLGACVDLVGGSAHIGIGKEAKATCCPLLQGLADLDAALCLCTTVRAKQSNANAVLPIVWELLTGCGKYPPPGYQCPSHA